MFSQVFSLSPYCAVSHKLWSNEKHMPPAHIPSASMGIEYIFLNPYSEAKLLSPSPVSHIFLTIYEKLGNSTHDDRDE